MNPAGYRKIVGLTRQQAARRLGVSTDYLGRAEREGFPPPVLARRAATLYGCMPLDEWYRAENFRRAGKDAAAAGTTVAAAPSG